MEESYLKVREDGSVALVRHSEQEGVLNREAFDALSRGVMRRVENVTRLDGQPVGLLISGGDCHCYQRLEALPLHSHFRFVKPEGILVPQFIKRSVVSQKQYPVFQALWTPPADMTVLFACRIVGHLSTAPRTTPRENCFLLAFSKDQRCWKLPLPNIYDDLSICMGDFDGRADSLIGAFAKALSQFAASDWNNDLAEGVGDKAERMFQFKPDGEGLQSLPCPEDWTSLCVKSAPAVATLMACTLDPVTPES